MFKHKNLIIDTSVLIDSPQAIHSFEKANIFLTLEVLEELDKHKTRKDYVGKSARYVNRFLDSLRKEQSLVKGATLSNGSKIYVLNGKGYLAPGFIEESNDNKIISIALKLSKEIPNVIVLSNDIAFRVKCDSFEVKAESYFSDEKYEKTGDKFEGMRIMEVLQEDVEAIHRGDEVYFPHEEFVINEGIILKGESSALAIAKDKHTLTKLKHVSKRGFNCEGIKPRNAEQSFAMELMLDPDIQLVTVIGKAGSGKTLMAAATAIHNYYKGNYKKIVLSRPVESTSKDIGFLPGDKTEKMAPWVQPFFDNLDVIIGDRSKMLVEQMMKKGQLEVESLSFIRGRSLKDTIFIVDEAQNINYHEAKALITRMGENSKLILIGDLEQIDSIKINEITSGLANTIEIFKEYKGAAHITLRKGERSPLATFAAENM